MTPRRFREKVRTYYERSGRHDLPWRRTRDPYRILVSEIMLQQTQVDRVRPFYERFVHEFPNVASLASAPLSRVLVLWQGLGYNRRARMLHEAAKSIVKDHGGKIPKDVSTLETLPGIGPYTARAVAAFAYNADVVFVETNLRTAVLHEFFSDREEVNDKEILEVLEKAFETGTSREWYAALMDYGAHLKRSGVRVNAKRLGYKKQAAFQGSGREARGAILKALTKKPEPEAYLFGILGPSRREQVAEKLAALTVEGLVEMFRGKYRLRD